MNFGDKIKKQKNLEESPREKYERLVINGDIHRSEDLITVANRIIALIQEDFQRSIPCDEYVESFWGKYKPTGKKYIEAQFWVDQIHPRAQGQNGRITYADHSDSEESYRFLYAEKDDINDIQKKIKKWCDENDIEFYVEISHMQYNHFRYRFRVWL